MRYCLIGALCLSALMAAGTAAADDLQISYTIMIESPETGTAHVRATISGLSSDGLRLVRSERSAPGWFDVMSARDASGRELRVAPAEGGYYVTTGQSPRVTVEYTIFPRAESTFGRVGIISSQYAALDGSQAFLLPGEEHNITSASLRYEGPGGWRAIVSWPRVRDEFVADESVAPLRLQLERSLLCFGDFRRISKGFGTNTLSVYSLQAHPESRREQLADSIQQIYERLYKALAFETGREYNVVCLPFAPDGVPVIAGAWSDGIAITLADDFSARESEQQFGSFAQLLTASYFAEEPWGVRLSEEDWWFYPAALRYGESLGLQAIGYTDENTFYGQLYTDYIAEAAADYSALDLPLSPRPSGTPALQSFLRRIKAPVLSMALDFEMRLATDGRVGLERLLAALLEQAGNGQNIRLEDAVADLSGDDFSSFFEQYVQQRTLILPLWPSFVDHLRAKAGEGPGPVAATVDGVPIYESEVRLLLASAPERATVMTMEQRYGAALEMLINEKLMDKALMQRGVRVVPEVFWQLRAHLPPKVLRVVMTKKRQVLKDMLFQEWERFERESSRIEHIGEPAEPAPAGAAR